MVRKTSIFLVLSAVIFLTAGIVFAADEAAKAQTQTAAGATSAESTQALTEPVNVGNKICPVSGQTIKEPGKDTVEYKGKIYNLCCPMCKETFLADPEKYVAKVNEELAKDKKEKETTSVVETTTATSEESMPEMK